MASEPKFKVLQVVVPIETYKGLVAISQDAQTPLGDTAEKILTQVVYDDQVSHGLKIEDEAA